MQAKMNNGTSRKRPISCGNIIHDITENVWEVKDPVQSNFFSLQSLSVHLS
uniref:Uncharacterized protein n=1 Tax=Anguilla anguilla TaxID=7936 RepID=A0A0E9QQ73_ANGAN